MRKNQGIKIQRTIFIYRISLSNFHSLRFVELILLNSLMILQFNIISFQIAIHTTVTEIK